MGDRERTVNGNLIWTPFRSLSPPCLLRRVLDQRSSVQIRPPRNRERRGVADGATAPLSFPGRHPGIDGMGAEAAFSTGIVTPALTRNRCPDKTANGVHAGPRSNVARYRPNLLQVDACVCRRKSTCA